MKGSFLPTEVDVSAYEFYHRHGYQDLQKHRLLYKPIERR